VEIETAYLELKSSILGGRVLRARTPADIAQEVYALLASYQILRHAHVPLIRAALLALLRDGRRAPRGTTSRNLYYPCCYRDSSEIRLRAAPSEQASGTQRGRAGQ
jgi:hypothetical protein